MSQQENEQQPAQHLLVDTLHERLEAQKPFKQKIKEKIEAARAYLWKAHSGKQKPEFLNAKLEKDEEDEKGLVPSGYNKSASITRACFCRVAQVST